MIVLSDDSGTSDSETDSEEGLPRHRPTQRAAARQPRVEDVEGMDVDDDEASIIKNEKSSMQAMPSRRASRPHDLQGANHQFGTQSSSHYRRGTLRDQHRGSLDGTGDAPQEETVSDGAFETISEAQTAQEETPQEQEYAFNVNGFRYDVGIQGRAPNTVLRTLVQSIHSLHQVNATNPRPLSHRPSSEEVFNILEHSTNDKLALWVGMLPPRTTYNNVHSKNVVIPTDTTALRVVVRLNRTHNYRRTLFFALLGQGELKTPCKVKAEEIFFFAEYTNGTDYLEIPHRPNAWCENIERTRYSLANTIWQALTPTLSGAQVTESDESDTGSMQDNEQDHQRRKSPGLELDTIPQRSTGFQFRSPTEWLSFWNTTSEPLTDADANSVWRSMSKIWRKECVPDRSIVEDAVTERLAHPRITKCLQTRTWLMWAEENDWWNGMPLEKA